ncbi:MAG: BspA family leucine-rich repeat surface protein [Prevotella sp.]|nr:BspA family leucine-rich repeat surface protein [Prevotella sp.]
MKKITTILFALVAALAVQAGDITVTVSDTRYQKITGFGAAACDGAMCPFGNDTQPVKLLYGPTSKIGLNIMRMEISPNFVGDVVVPEWGYWDTPYDWKGSLPSAKIVKERGGIVFGTPWSPPGEYKTNGTAQGGNAEDQGYQRGQLREDCYDKFFPWLNTFLEYMKTNGVNVDAVSVQNEPDWWVNYSGCLYTPQQQLNLVKNYAHMLDRKKYNGVRLISAEPLGFDPSYSNMLLRDQVARDQIDIVAGHIYGHPPLGNLKSAAVLASQYGKEVWMTEHSVTENVSRLPNWHEQLLFAEELNECMLAGCTAYIYWYMRAHWAFVGTGESQYNPGNTKNALLPRAYVMSHFSKHVTGSTRLGTTASVTTGTNSAFETSAYIKGDSIIVMAIDTTKNANNLKLKLPCKVKSGIHLLSTANDALLQELPINISQPVSELTVTTPARSLNTYIFIIDDGPGPYLAVSEDGKTATFYLDDKKSERTGTVIGLDAYEGLDTSVAAGVTNVVFDPSFADARPTSTYKWFFGMSNLTTIEGMEYLNTSEVTTMRSMFNKCSSLVTLDLSTFNTSKVTNMAGMFNDCAKLTSIDLSSFNTSNVTTMENMFIRCYGLVSLDVSNFDMSKVTNTSLMFNNCKGLESFAISGTMGKLDAKACNGVGTEKAPCFISAPNSFDFGVETVGSFQWKAGWFYMYPLGDVNHDGDVNVVDVTMTVSHILGQSADNFHIENADMNGDNVVNVTDVMFIVDLIMLNAS